jgi:hypothetical protein
MCRSSPASTRCERARVSKYWTEIFLAPENIPRVLTSEPIAQTLQAPSKPSFGYSKNDLLPLFDRASTLMKLPYGIISCRLCAVALPKYGYGGHWRWGSRGWRRW